MMRPGTPRPRALFLTPVVPARTGLGLAMRAASQLAGLMRIFDVAVVVIPCAGASPAADSFHASFEGAELEVLDIRDQMDPLFRIIATLPDASQQLALFARYGKPSLAAAVTPGVAGRVADIARSAGARWVHVFRSYLVGAVDQLPADMPRSIDLDEDDASSYRSTAAVLHNQGRTAEAHWSMLEADGFERLLAQKLASFRAVTLANAMDVASMRQRYGSMPRAIPNCVMLPRQAALARAVRAGRPHMLFVGALGYRPNIDGLEWFLSSILPRLPGARLRIAGGNPPRSLRTLAPRGRVEFLGYVADLTQVYRQSALAIAPMRSGGGTRLKILEAGAFAVPVVATPQAAAGLWNSIRPWGKTAGSASSFAAACRYLLGNPEAAERLGASGRETVSRRFSSGRIDAAWADMFARLHYGEDA